jgi:uncharacterized protein (TIGR02001 family)
MRWVSRITSSLMLTTAFGAGLSAAPPAQAGEFDAGVAVSSDYVLHGLTRSQGKPVAQAQLGWANEAGWNVGTWFSTVDFNAGPSVSRELDFYLGKRWSLGKDVALLTELTQYTFDVPRGQSSSYDYAELRVGLSFREWIELSAGVSPNYTAYAYGTLRQDTAIHYGATARYPATRWLSFNVGVGRFDLERLFGHTYTYWSAGGGLTFGAMDLSLGYIGSDETASELFGRDAGDRFVATLALRLP